MSRRARVFAEVDEGQPGWSADLYQDGEWQGGCWCPTWRGALAIAQGYVERDPTHGRIDRDIQELVETMQPVSRAQRVAIENTLQRQRDNERGAT